MRLLVRAGPLATVEWVDGLLLKTVEPACRAEVDALAHLRADPFCATRLVARVGDLAFLGSWLPAEALAAEVPAEAATQAVLAFHARHPERDVPAAIPRWQPLAGPLPATAAARVTSALAVLGRQPRVLLHGDWVPENAATLAGGAVAAFDFGCAHVGYGVEDVARYGGRGPYSDEELRAGLVLSRAFFYQVAVAAGLPGLPERLALILAV